jgi:hypothetical protein
VIVQITLMLDLGSMDGERFNALLDRMKTVDWAALHEITQGGEDEEPFASGGFNLISIEQLR